MKIILYFILGISCSLLYACQNQYEKRDVQMVQEWHGKTIEFPTDCIFTRYAIDTIDYQMPQSSYKVLVYVDSIGCVSCKLQLPKWKKFIKTVDSISNKGVPFIFFFNTKYDKEIYYILKRNKFDYPVCIDKDDKLNKLNTFPKYNSFQTFMLDEENKVCIIGNPIYNLNIQDLYLKKIENCFNEKKLLNTIVKVDVFDYDLGIVSKKTVKEQIVTLYNRGEYPFYIRGVTTSCDCIEAFYDWIEIPVGKDKVVTVQYEAEQEGEFLRTITIYGNIPEKQLVLNFAGIVK